MIFNLALLSAQNEMTAEATVSRSANWSRFLVKKEQDRTALDKEAAMERVASRLIMPVSTLWAFDYREPKTVAAHIYLRLQSAYAAECERQRRFFEHERQVTEAIAGPDAHLVRAALALAGTQEE